MSLDMTKLTGGVEKTKGKNEIIITARFYIKDATDLPDYELDYGDDVTSDFSSYFQSGEYDSIKVRSAKSVEVIPSHRVPTTVIVTASTNLYKGGTYTTSDLGDIVKKKFYFAEVYVDPAWYRARKADKTDVLNEYMSFYTDAACKEGEWLFSNASSSTIGTAVTTDSLLYYAPSSPPGATTVQALVGKKFITRAYQVLYYSTKSMSKIDTLVGVSPATNAFPTKCKPPGDSTTAKLWRSLGDILETVIDKNGKEWTKIDRKIIRAPKVDGVQSYWNPDTCGGDWKWT